MVLYFIQVYESSIETFGGILDIYLQESARLCLQITQNEYINENERKTAPDTNVRQDYIVFLGSWGCLSKSRSIRLVAFIGHKMYFCGIFRSDNWDILVV